MTTGRQSHHGGDRGNRLKLASAIIRLSIIRLSIIRLDDGCRLYDHAIPLQEGRNQLISWNRADEDE